MLLLLKTSEALGEKSKFESIFFSHSLLFINLQMSAQCEFVFLDTATVTFCLIYS